MKYKTLAIIPARGGSKSVPRKNIKLLNGEPLISYSIKMGLESKYIDRIIVSTEDNEIAEIAKGYGAEVVERPIQLSQDDTPSLPVFQQVLRYLEENEDYDPDIVVILQPTSPLRKVQDIDSCIKKLIDEKCDSVITVKKVEYALEWILKIDDGGLVKNLFNNENKAVRRQDAEDIYIPNGAVYVAWKKVITEKDTLKGPDTRAIVMPQERSIDIDTELDFVIAEKLYKEFKKH